MLKRSELDELMGALGGNMPSNERQRRIEYLLSDPRVAFNVLYRHAELFAPREKLMLSKSAFEAIAHQSGSTLSIERARVLLGVSWMLSHMLRKKLIDFIAASPAEAAKLLKNPPEGMRLRSTERARLVKAIRACPQTAYKLLHDRGACIQAKLTQADIQRLAWVAITPNNSRKLLNALRDKHQLPLQVIRKLAQAA